MESNKARTLAIGIVIVLLSLPAGFIVLSAITWGLDWLWFSTAVNLGTLGMWAMALLVPTIAGALVALIRKAGNDGHSPLLGITVAPVYLKDYPSIVGAIAISLMGGLVLGPEAAMVCTGAVIGTVIASHMNIDLKAGAGFGALGAILALFVHPVLNGSFTVSAGYQFRWIDLVGALVVGIITSIVILAGRILAIGIDKLHPSGLPSVKVTAFAGLLVGLIAMIYHTISNQDIDLVLTSGESNVKQMLELGSVGLILLTVAAKWIVYSLSMGGGFRGGPFFPAIYIGGGIGGIMALLAPNLAQGAVVAGLVAAVVYLAHSNWPSVIVTAVVVGLLGGGVALVPIALVAAVVARLIPIVRLDAKDEAQESATTST